MKVVGSAVASAIFALALTGCGGGAGETANATEEAKPAGPPIELTATALQKEVEKNEAAAKDKFAGKTIKLSGVVDSIQLDLMDEPFVVFKAGEYSMVHANLADDAKPKAKTLSKGQKLTVTCGSMGEVVGFPVVDDCTF